jgi:hypothetical protein
MYKTEGVVANDETVIFVVCYCVLCISYVYVIAAVSVVYMSLSSPSINTT